MTELAEHGHCEIVVLPASATDPGSARARELPGELEVMYREHADFVLRVAHQLGVDALHVEDVAHDVFLVVHRRLADFDGHSLRSWLYGITRRVALHHHRGAARAQRRAREHAPVPHALPDPEQRAELNRAVELREHEHRALIVVECRDECFDQLDDDQRTVFVLAELEGVPVPEISAQLGVNLNTVYSRLRLARRRFERAVADARMVEPRDG